MSRAGVYLSVFLKGFKQSFKGRGWVDPERHFTESKKNNVFHFQLTNLVSVTPSKCQLLDEVKQVQSNGKSGIILGPRLTSYFGLIRRAFVSVSPDVSSGSSRSSAPGPMCSRSTRAPRGTGSLSASMPSPCPSSTTPTATCTASSVWAGPR